MHHQLVTEALRYMGQKEVDGLENNPHLMHLLNLADNTLTNDSEPANCSLLLMGLFLKLGYNTNGINGLARSWMGLENAETVFENRVWETELRAGDVCIFSRGKSSWQGHVGVALGGLSLKAQIPLFSFNRSNTAKVEAFGLKKLLKVVRPLELQDNTFFENDFI